MTTSAVSATCNSDINPTTMVCSYRTAHTHNALSYTSAQDITIYDSAYGGTGWAGLYSCQYTDLSAGGAGFVCIHTHIQINQTYVGSVPYAEGVVCHEFSHALGYLDQPANYPGCIRNPADANTRDFSAEQIADINAFYVGYDPDI